MRRTPEISYLLTFTLASTILIAAQMVMIGWLVKKDFLVQLTPSSSPIQFNTALIFMLLMLSIQLKKSNWYFLVYSLLNVLLGLTALEYLLDVDLKIDNIIHHHIAVNPMYPGRMAPNTLLTFILCSLSVWATRHAGNLERRHFWGGYLAILVFGMGFISIMGYVLGVEHVYFWGKITGMALQTAILFLFTGLTLFFLNYRLVRSEDQKEFRSSVILGIAVALQITFFLVDLSMPMGVAAGTIHVIAIVLCSLSEKKKHLLLTLVLSLILVWAPYVFSPPVTDLDIVFANRIITSFLLVLVYALSYFTMQYSMDLRFKNQNLDNIIRKKTQELENRNKDLENFVYVIAHDLREPVQIMESYARLLKDTNKERLDDLGTRSLDYLESNSLHLNRLVKGLLVFAQVGSRSRLKSVSLQEILFKVLDELKSDIKANSAQIHNTKLPRILGYEEELTMLFREIIHNALQFRKSSDSPVIQIEYFETQHFHQLSFKDNGMGIEKVFQTRIFNLFNRLHDRASIYGIGLGLALSEKIAKLHEGSIRVESEPGVGSTFIITLSKNILDV